ncbi:unnamed protein product [Linum trigynum]|uniref:CCHC-type domain-containing protein n=1 Tax=Linum trigynum TaxID=586398 RepID=A0AAV2DGG8_9ROSI
MAGIGISDLLKKTESLSVSDSLLRFKPKRGPAERKRSEILVGKLICEKKYNAGGMDMLIARNWRDVKKPTVVQIDINTFVITFCSPEDKEKIWEARPWKIADTLLVLKEWTEQGKVRTDSLDFNRSRIWIQIHDFPSDLRTEENVALPLGEIFKELIRGDESGVAEGIYMNFIRVLVVLDISEPLPPGFYIEIEEGKEHWVEFKYERLPSNCCYCCGRIGHTQLVCKHPEEYIEGRYGDWIRAGPHSPASPFSAVYKINTPGTAESKTADNFSQAIGGRTAASYLDGRLSGGRGFQRKDRGGKVTDNYRSNLPSPTALMAGVDSGNSGPPPGFVGGKAVEKEGIPITMKQTGDFSPFKPRSLFHEEEQGERGGNSQQVERGQGSGSQTYQHMGMGQAIGAQTFQPFFPLGQTSFFPSPNYLQMAQESYMMGQAQQPFVLWDNKQMEAQFLSPWGLRAQEPRKKLKVNRKRKPTALSMVPDYEMEVAGFDHEVTDEGNESGKEKVALHKPPKEP